METMHERQDKREQWEGLRDVPGQGMYAVCFHRSRTSALLFLLLMLAKVFSNCKVSNNRYRHKYPHDAFHLRGIPDIPGPEILASQKNQRFMIACLILLAKIGFVARDIIWVTVEKI